ncbi:MAG: hypothetical protein NTU91_12455, partial [Chloroflexi bacterium]|nr:hypothetical protein [Chloroflexota bacterium]
IQTSQQWWPRISGNTVVWSDHRGPQLSVIYGYDLDTRTEYPIWTSGDGGDMPSINGNIVAWRNFDGTGQGSTSHIFAEDLSTGQVTAVCTAIGGQWAPCVGTDMIVWSDTRNGRQDIYGKSLATGQEFFVTTAGDINHEVEAWIAGNTVVWKDGRDGEISIYGKDLVSGNEFPICTALGIQISPRIDGHTVVWKDARSDTGDIYSTNLVTGQELLICSPTSPVANVSR